MNVSLFDMLPPYVLAAIDTWLAGIEYHNKSKHVLSIFKYMRNPVLCTIPTKYWTPYHNFASFRTYNSTKYEWLHISIYINPEECFPHYKFLANKS